MHKVYTIFKGDMDISGECYEVIVFVAKDGIKAVIKKMTALLVAEIVILRVSGKELCMMAEIFSLPLLNSRWTWLSMRRTHQ